METNKKDGFFEWKIPSMPYNRKLLLCQGYTRENYNKYFIQPLIKLFALFYHYDEYTLDDIKNARHKQPFTSPIVCLEGLKWYLELSLYLFVLNQINMYILLYLNTDYIQMVVMKIMRVMLYSLYIW